MSVVINTNVDSLKIQNSLSSATSKMSTAMERMSSGLKINSAADDAAGVVISAKMNVQLSGNKVAQSNIQAANSMLSTTEGSLDTILDNVSRIRDLTLQAKNGTYSKDEVQAMQDEVTQRMQEIDRVSQSSKYSDIQLFGDTAGLAKNGAKFQVGSNGDSNNEISVDKSVFESVKFSALTGLQSGETFDLTKMKDGSATGTAADFDKAITALDSAVNSITTKKSTIGSTQDRLDTALSNLATQYENLSSANSLITDADIASEASNYTQQSILQQVSTSLLASANSAPSIALSLI